MKNYTLLLLLILFSTMGQAQEIGGRLLNSASAEPVANARINVLQGQQTTQTIVSGTNGSFSIKVAQLPVTLQIETLGFAQQEVVVEEADQSLRIFLYPEAESLSEVILQGTVIPTSLQETPASVSLLTSADLERHDETNLMTAINTVPGVYVHQGALNTNKLSIRGVGARSQYSTNRVKAYFEGIPISSAEGETTLDDIDQEVVERVEIIKGPTSSVYGAGLGGVINLYAAGAGREGSKASVGTTFGSFGLQKQSVKASHATQNSSIFAAYNHLQTDSFRENGAYDRESITLHGEVGTSEASKLSVLVNYTQLMAYIPSSINEEQFRNEPEGAAFTWGASQGYESYDKGQMGLSYQQQLSEAWSNTTSVFMSFRNANEPRPFDILREEQVGTGARTKFNHDFSFLGSPSQLSFGSEYYTEWYDTATYENLYEENPGQGSVSGNNLSNNTQERSYLNVFAQWNLPLAERLSAELGVNFNTTRYALEDLYHRDAIDQSGDYEFGSILSPRLGLLYDLTEDHVLYASVSHGFSTPAVAETLTPEGLINTSLRPETGINYELGFKGNWLNNRLYTELALFSIQVENLVVAERVGEDQYIGRNAGKTDHNGLEFFVAYRGQLGPEIGFKPFLNASLNHFQFDEFVDDGTDYSGNWIPGVPERNINAGVDLTGWGVGLHASYQHVGEIPLNDANTGYSEAYDLFHLKASYGLELFQGMELELFAGVNNLFGEHYASSILPNAVGFGGAAPRYYYPGNPRNYYGGLRLEYGF